MTDKEALQNILLIADGYVSEGDLPVMVVIQTICKQALAQQEASDTAVPDVAEEAARLRQRVSELQAAIRNIKEALAAQQIVGSIIDTLWVLPDVSPSQTLFDYIDEIIDSPDTGHDE